MKGIVIGIRDDTACPALVEWTERFTRLADMQVTLVHAVPRRSLWFIAGMQVDSTTYLEAKRAHFTNAVLEPLRRRGIQADLEIDIGDAAEALVERAHESHADLIAIGGPRHTRFHGVFTGSAFGSTASKLAHITDVPLVVMPAVHEEPPARKT